MSEGLPKRFSGNAALNYETYLGPFQFEPYAKYVGGLIPPTGISSVLEIASGTGRLTRHLRKQFPSPVKFVATDFSPDMLEVAKGVLQDDSIEYMVADAQELPFEDNSFDLVYCQFGLMFMPHKDKAFSEAHRVLKPGGKFIFSTWDSIDNIPFLDLVYNKHVIPAYKGTVEKKKFTLPFSLYEPEVLKDYLERASFKNSQVDKVSLMAQSPSPQDLTFGIILNHPLGIDMTAFDPDSPVRVANELNIAIAEQFGSNPVRCEMHGFVGVGVK